MSPSLAIIDQNQPLQHLLTEAQDLASAGRYSQAVPLLERVTHLAPHNPSAWLLLGNAFNMTGEHARAIGAYTQSLGLWEANDEAHHNLGCAHYRLGEYGPSLQHLERAAALTTQLAPWTAMATMIPGHPGARPERILAVRRAFAERLAVLNPDLRLTSCTRPPSGRLKVGFLSTHFDQPNYMKPVWGLINHLDRQSLEVHLLSDAPTQTFIGYRPHRRDQLHTLRGMDNSALCALVRDLGLDALVDLNAYSHPVRLAVFAHTAGLPTFAWFNMYATSGLPGFGTLVGDARVVEADEQNAYTEQVARLPLSYLTFTVGYRVPPVVPPPCLRNGFLTFGCLAPQYKFTDAVITAWSKILHGAPRLRLTFANNALRSVHNRQHLAERFQRAGVDPERIDFLGPAEHYNFLQTYDRIDMALDTFPYNGGTTTMEALWQGVPVLTFPGDRWAARIGASLLSGTHLGDFVRAELNDYVGTAVALAQDPATPSRLESLRKSMRHRLRRSPACDTPRLAAAFQQVLYERVRVRRD